MAEPRAADQERASTKNPTGPAEPSKRVNVQDSLESQWHVSGGLSTEQKEFALSHVIARRHFFADDQRRLREARAQQTRDTEIERRRSAGEAIDRPKDFKAAAEHETAVRDAIRSLFYTRESLKHALKDPQRRGGIAPAEIARLREAVKASEEGKEAVLPEGVTSFPSPPRARR